MIWIFIFTLGFGPQGYAVVNGLPAPEEKFAAVGSLRIGSGPGVGCTATLIAKNWIVTAGHCTDDLKPSRFEFRLGVDFKKPFFKSKLKRWVQLKTDNDDDQNPIDIAFGELEVALPSKTKVRPLQIASPAWNANDLQDTYVHIGFGVQIPFTEGTHQRQQAHFEVTAAQGNALLQLFGNQDRLKAYIETYHPQLSLDEEPLESILAGAELLADYQIHAWDPRGRADLRNISAPVGGWQDTCFGDSGGPLLREMEGQLRLVGVVSRGMNRTCEALGTKFTTFGPRVRDLMKAIGLDK